MEDYVIVKSGLEHDHMDYSAKRVMRVCNQFTSEVLALEGLNQLSGFNTSDDVKYKLYVDYDLYEQVLVKIQQMEDAAQDAAWERDLNEF